MENHQPVPSEGDGFMDGIAVSATMLLLKGIPEGFIIAWGMLILTNTKVEKKKYLLLSLLYIVITYLVRFLPITLGINTVLSVFVMIFSYQTVYHAGLNKMIRAMIAAIVILVFTAISEILNVILLTVLYGSEQANAFVTSTNDLTQAIYTTPSTVFLALFAVAGYFILKAIRKRMSTHGKPGKEISE
jgi:hypothetical protein